MKFSFVFFFSFCLVSCSNHKFEYPGQLHSDSEKRQYEKGIWLIYKFQYKLPVYEVDSPFFTPKFNINKIDVSFVECDVTLRKAEKNGDTITYSFDGIYHTKDIVNSPEEDGGIPRMSFIGISDSIRRMSDFFVADYPQNYGYKSDESANKFVYDTLGDAEFISYLKQHEKVLSPSLRFLCKKRGIF